MLNSQCSGEKNQEKKCQLNSGRDKDQRIKFFGLRSSNPKWEMLLSE